MQPTGYSPYRHAEKSKKRSFKLPKIEGRFKKWLLVFIGVVAGFLLIGYLSLGELRFFANNYLRLGFFSKNYLILLQNNYETRPTGGFLTGYGEVRARMGFVSDISFHNSYEIDTETYVTPPYPHEELLKNEWYEGYTFRDANWDPHFPASAQTLIEFYQQKFPENDVDGIIVLNFTMIERLVDALGGIEINGELISGERLFKALTDTVNDVDRHDETALMERKSILGELAARIIPKAKWHPFKTKAVIEEALGSKDLFLWFSSPRLQAKIEKRGWANTMSAPENADFLAVNLANLGSKKADRYLLKEVYHHVNLQKELPEVTTEVVLRYPGSKNTFADDYKGYLRIYLPAGATVEGELFGATVEKEGDFTVIGTQVILPAGNKATFSYQYFLPRTLLPNEEYRLKLIKQSGDSKDYSITVEAGEDRGMTSGDFEVRENWAVWEGKLMEDKEIALSLLADQSPPYPIEQVFESLNTIVIHWNEAIDSATGNDALNYSLMDADSTASGVTDEVKVIYAELDGDRVSRLQLEGITDQPLERYKLTFEDIRDTAGNTIEPNPKEVTVVQRLPEE